MYVLKSLAPVIFSGDEVNPESSTAEQIVKPSFVWPNTGVSPEGQSSSLRPMSYLPASCPKLNFQTCSASADRSPGTKITWFYLNLVSQSWSLTSIHHLIYFSNKMLQTCGAGRMLWLNPQWKHFRYNVDAAQICRDSYSPALPAAPLPWPATRSVSRLGFQPAVGLPVQVRSHGGWWRSWCSSLGSLHCPWPRRRQRCLKAPLNWCFQSAKGVLCEQWSHHSNSDSFWQCPPSGLISLNSEVTQYPEVQKTINKCQLPLAL